MVHLETEVEVSFVSMSITYRRAFVFGHNRHNRGFHLQVGSVVVLLAGTRLSKRDRDKKSASFKHSLTLSGHQRDFLVGLRTTDQCVYGALVNDDIEETVWVFQVRTVHDLP